MHSRKPPVETRFRKGLSGNPKGRPRRKQRSPVSIGSLFRKVAKEHIRLENDGVTVRMSLWDAYVRQIYTMALNKNQGAARLLGQLRNQFPGELLPGDPTTFLMYESDANL
jgi:hypothetical protein